jgi:hypothetical protein
VLPTVFTVTPAGRPVWVTPVAPAPNV